MNDSFDQFYGQPNDPFYYGLKPSKDLKAFLDTANPPRGEALDPGYGEGRNSLLLALYGFRVHAVDTSSQGIQKLETFTRSHQLDTITCEVSDVRELPLTPRSYNAIIAATLLDHLTKEEGKKLAEAIIAALKSGGFVYASVFTTRDPGASQSTPSEAPNAISETGSFFQALF